MEKGFDIILHQIEDLANENENTLAYQYSTYSIFRGMEHKRNKVSQVEDEEIKRGKFYFFQSSSITTK